MAAGETRPLPGLFDGGERVELLSIFFRQLLAESAKR